MHQNNGGRLQRPSVEGSPFTRRLRACLDVMIGADAEPWERQRAEQEMADAIKRHARGEPLDDAGVSRDPKQLAANDGE